MGFALGFLPIENAVFPAPMTGVTDLPFRRLMRRYGASLVFSEMIASRPMLEQLKKHTPKNYADEFPLAVQIAGCDPEIMAEAARINEARGAAIIDLNFGCPVKKIVNQFAGAAVMKDELLAANIMRAVKNAVSVPVTVKMRLGWDDDSVNAPRLARIAEDIGLEMVTVHGRTRQQLYNGAADWSAVHAVKDAVKIPVIVNGDITDRVKAEEAMAKSGADGVMIGRGSFGRPWLIGRIMAKVDGVPSTKEISDLILEHYDMILTHHGLHTGIGIARKHIGWYLADYPDSEIVRSEINRMDNPANVVERLENYFNFFQTRNSESEAFSSSS